MTKWRADFPSKDTQLPTLAHEGVILRDIGDTYIDIEWELNTLGLITSRVALPDVDSDFTRWVMLFLRQFVGKTSVNLNVYADFDVDAIWVRAIEVYPVPDDVVGYSRSVNFSMLPMDWVSDDD